MASEYEAIATVRMICTAEDDRACFTAGNRTTSPSCVLLGALTSSRGVVCGGMVETCSSRD